jgi:vacuolar-type H+-ATPase subunit E/Vma4
MGLEEILKGIKSRKEATLAQIASDTKAQRDKIIGEAKEQAKAIAKEGRAHAKRDAELIEARETSKARIEGKMIYNNALNDRIEEALTSIRNDLGSFTKSNTYNKLLDKLANEVLAGLGNDCTIFANSNDIAYLKGRIKGGNLIQAKEEFIGGIKAVSKDGRREMDYSLESIMEGLRDGLASRIIEELRGEE